MANMIDVAKLAGLSLYTVSKVINGRIPVKKSTRDKVQEACRRLGYERNLYAVNLVTRTNNTIGMIVSQIINPFYGEILEAAEKTANALGYQLLCRCSYMDPAQEAAALKHFLSLKVGGIIVSPVVTEENRELLSALEMRLPVVYVDRYCNDDCHYVVNDHFQSARMVTEHLLERGASPHYLGSFQGVSSRAMLDRERGYRQAMTSSDLEPRFVRPSPGGGMDNEDYGYASMMDHLQVEAAPEALFCATDSIAIGAMRALEENGLRVGRDVLVAGHDDLHYSAFLNPPLTTVAQPKRHMGEEAVRAVKGLIESGGGKPIQKTFPSQLRIRASSLGSRVIA